MRVERTGRSRDAQSVTGQKRVESVENAERRQQRERRLPPKPSWYGSRENATASAILAKKTLTSRGGKRTPKR